jgi:hypothetical protein
MTGNAFRGDCSWANGLCTYLEGDCMSSSFSSLMGESSIDKWFLNPSRVRRVRLLRDPSLRRVPDRFPELGVGEQVPVPRTLNSSSLISLLFLFLPLEATRLGRDA